MRLFRQQSRRNQNARIGGVRAGSNCRYHHIAVAQRVRFFRHLNSLGQVVGALAVSAVGFRQGNQFGKLPLQRAQGDAVLRALGSGDRRLHFGQIQLQHLRILARFRRTEHPLRLMVGFNRRQMTPLASGGAEIIQCLLIHRKESHCRPVFRGHVADCGAVRRGQGARPLAEELNKFPNHFCFPQNLRDRQDEVGGGDSGVEFSAEFHSHHIGGQHIHGLSQHGGFRLYAAHAPSDNAHAVYHGCVRVGADQRIGIIHAVLLHDAARQMLQVDLMHNAHAGGDHLKSVEGGGAPFQEFIALAVAGEFNFHVEFGGVGSGVMVHLHGVVHDQIHRGERLHRVGGFSLLGGGFAHCRQVRQQRNAGEILQHHAGDDKGNFLLAGGARLPVCQRLDMPHGHALAVAVSHQRFQNHAQAHRQAGNRPDSLGLQLGQRIQLPLMSVAGEEFGAEIVGEHGMTPVGDFLPGMETRIIAF